MFLVSLTLSSPWLIHGTGALHRYLQALYYMITNFEGLSMDCSDVDPINLEWRIGEAFISSKIKYSRKHDKKEIR
jgi:hypothetical protein